MEYQMLNDSVANHVVDEDSMVLPELTSVMKVELLVNPDGDVWILHDDAFSGILHWVEFDALFQSITLVMRDGRTQDVGVFVNDNIAQRLIDGKMLFTILTNNDKIRDMYAVPIVVRK